MQSVLQPGQITQKKNKTICFSISCVYVSQTEFQNFVRLCIIIIIVIIIIIIIIIIINTNSAKLQKARHLQRESQTGTNQRKDSIAEKTKERWRRKKDAWTIPT
jgi:amino acid permease